MSFEQIKQTRIADQIAVQIEEKLVRGVLKPGDKLPSERELSKLLSVSRPSVREALQKLEARQILKKPPRGGAYIAEDIDESFIDPFTQLFIKNLDAPFELLEIRRALEGTSAYYAALRASPDDRENIRQKFITLDEAHQKKQIEQEATADVEFHLAIAEASHNMMMVQLMRRLFSVLQKSVVFSFTQLYMEPDMRSKLPDQHKIIMEAIITGNPDLAKEKMLEHIISLEDMLKELQQKHQGD